MNVFHSLLGPLEVFEKFRVGGFGEMTIQSAKSSLSFLLTFS